MKATAQTIALECNCGGAFMDTRSYSYTITNDTKQVKCDGCAKLVTSDKFPKTARLF